MNRIYLILLIVFVYSRGFGQSQDFQLELASRLQAFYDSHRFQKLNIIMAQPKYAPGDTVFFKGYLSAVENRSLIKGKQIVNIELRTNDNVVSLHKRFLFVDGLCSSQFALQDSFEPGYYRLIAYSDQMIEKNSTPSFFYNSEFLISGETEFVKIQNGADVQFFPESGKLIRGFNNKVYLNSKFIRKEVEIVNDKDSLILRFLTDENGSATFNISPNSSSNYFLKYENEKSPLPEIFSDRIFLSVQEHTEGMRVQVGVSNHALLKGTNLFLAYTIHNKIYFFETLNFNERKSIDIEISKNQCGEGIGLITIFNSNYEALVQRQIFTHQKQFQFDVSFDKKKYSTRESATIIVSVKDHLNTFAKSNLAVSVIQDTLFQNSPGLNAQTFIKNDIQNSNIEKNIFLLPTKKLNDFMISQKWDWFDWKEILDTKEKSKPGTVYPYYFKGKALLTTTNSPPPDSTSITFYLQNDDFVYNATTDSNGNFGFPLFKNFDDNEVFYKAYYRGEHLKDAKIILNNVSTPVEKTFFKANANRDVYGSYVKEKIVIARSYSYYNIKTKQDRSLRIIDDIVSDYSVDLEKFEAFHTMADVLSNVVSMVHFKKTKHGEGVRIFLEKNNYYSTEDPLYIIDGIMTSNTEYFLSLDPTTVSKIRILRTENKLRPYGLLGTNGILVVDTKMVDVSSSIPRMGNNLSIVGITKPVQCNNHGCKDKLIPDLRTVIYWNPNVTTSEVGQTQFTINTGDATGKHTVILDGFTEEGIPLHYQTSFYVYYKP